MKDRKIFSQEISVDSEHFSTIFQFSLKFAKINENLFSGKTKLDNFFLNQIQQNAPIDLQFIFKFWLCT